MLRSIQQLYGGKLGASDGEIGHLKDFYFSDRNWAVRYVVVDTGHWLPGRQVLISPHAFGGAPPAGKVMQVKLTRKQIEDSPAIETHEPVSRQYEEVYNRYYGWPSYWQGDGLWGVMGDFPMLELPPNPAATAPPAAAGPKPDRADAHLRSTQAVKGYHLQASDGIIGQVSDFIMDDRNWAIGQLAIRIGNRFTGKEVQVSVSHVDRISYNDSTVFVKLTKEAVEQSPVHPSVATGAAD